MSMDSDSSRSDKGMVASANAAITQTAWWEAMRVLCLLAHVIRLAVKWCVTCPCHSHLLASWDSSDGSEHRGLINIWRTCPMRGKRLPEVVAGDFLEYVRTLLDTASARLLVDLSN